MVEAGRVLAEAKLAVELARADLLEKVQAHQKAEAESQAAWHHEATGG